VELYLLSTSASMPYTGTMQTFFLHTKLQIPLVRNFGYHTNVKTQRMDENRVLRQIFVSRKEDEAGS